MKIETEALPATTNVWNKKEEETSVAAARRNQDRRRRRQHEAAAPTAAAAAAAAPDAGGRGPAAADDGDDDLEFDAKELNALTSACNMALLTCPLKPTAASLAAAAAGQDEDAESIELTPRRRAFKSTAV